MGFGVLVVFGFLGLGGFPCVFVTSWFGVLVLCFRGGLLFAFHFRTFGDLGGLSGFVLCVCVLWWWLGLLGLGWCFTGFFYC